MPKEIAEHIQLMDLGRNDIGRVSQPGSVSVTDKMTIERYSHVMHIVSNVEDVYRVFAPAPEDIAFVEGNFRHEKVNEFRRITKTSKAVALFNSAKAFPITVTKLIDHLLRYLIALWNIHFVDAREGSTARNEGSKKSRNDELAHVQVVPVAVQSGLSLHATV